MKNIDKNLLFGTLYIIVMLLLSGCTTYIRDHQIARQHLFNYKYPDQLAVDCAKQFPVKDSVGAVTSPININYTGKIDSLQNLADKLGNVIDSLLLNVIDTGKPVDTSKYRIAINYLKTQNGTLQTALSNLKASYKPCKPDTIPHYIIDKAKETVMRNQYKAAHDSLTTAKANQITTDHSKNIWMRMAIGCMLLIIVSAVVWVYKTFFASGAIANTIKKVV